MLQLEKKLFDYFNQDVFRDNNGTAVSSLLNSFKGVSWELTYKLHFFNQPFILITPPVCRMRRDNSANTITAPDFLIT